MHTRYGHLAQVGRSTAIARHRPSPGPRLLDPQPRQHLRRGGHAEAGLDQGALAAAVEGEPAAPGEQLVEERQVERRLLVGGGMQDRPVAHERQAAHRRVVEVGVEGEHVGVAGRHRVEQRGRARALQVDPPLHVRRARPTAGSSRSRAHSGWKEGSRPASDATRRTLTPLTSTIPSGSSSCQVMASRAHVVMTSTSQPRSATRCSASIRAPVSAPPRTSAP